MKTRLLLVIFLFAGISHAQWSTSPHADSGLYVCPGFVPGVVTFEDGSSIVLGILSSYIYAQKLDPQGYKMWPEPVVVHYNDSSGMFIEYESERDWFCSDGEGGCVLLISETQFDYPGAADKNYLKIMRYNEFGERLWKTVLDSSFTLTSKFQLNYIYNGGNFYYLTYYQNENVLKRINYNGELDAYKNLQYSGFAISDNQYIFFRNVDSYINGFHEISKINSNADTLWTTTISFQNFCSEGGGQLVPDNLGGVFMTHICHDSIMYFDFNGELYYKEFEGIDIGGFEFPDGNNGIITYNDTLTKRFDHEGISLWQDGVTFLHDPENAYSSYYVTDNNGGIIITYWSTIGGIFAQHTGRDGCLGIVTGIKDLEHNVPKAFQLYQNYPNPFNASTKIEYQLSKSGYVDLSVYNTLGQKVAILVSQTQQIGTYKIEWNGSDFADGLYFYRFKVGKYQDIRKMLLVK